LIKFVNSAASSWLDVVERHDSQARASTYSNTVPWPDPLPFPPDQRMSPAFLVPNVIRPLTATVQGSLFARVPVDHKGRPDLFVSHAWSSPLEGSVTLGTLQALDSPYKRHGPVKRVWLDVVSYNQHHVESIAADMQTVVGRHV
jgi:hypothetical protein